MDIQTLQKHVLTLATIKETDAPMVSCYLNLEKGLTAARRILNERVRLLRKTLPTPQRDSFEHALLGIESRLAAGFQTESLGAAVFARDGEQKVIVQLPLYRSNQALDIFKITLDIWKVMKYAGVDECEGAPESGGWTKAA